MAALKAQVQSLPDYQKTAISKMIDVATQLDEIFDTFTLQDQRAVQRKVLLTLTPIQEAFLTLALTKNFDDKALYVRLGRLFTIFELIKPPFCVAPPMSRTSNSPKTRSSNSARSTPNAAWS